MSLASVEHTLLHPYSILWFFNNVIWQNKIFLCSKHTYWAFKTVLMCCLITTHFWAGWYGRRTVITKAMWLRFLHQVSCHWNFVVWRSARDIGLTRHCSVLHQILPLLLLAYYCGTVGCSSTDSSNTCWKHFFASAPTNCVTFSILFSHVLLTNYVFNLFAYLQEPRQCRYARKTVHVVLQLLTL